MNSRVKPKQFLNVYGKPIIIHTLEVFDSHPDIDAIVVACLEEWIPYLNELIDKYNLKKVKKVVPGGKSGQESIYHGLLAAEEVAGQERSIVLIHDGVRPLIDGGIILLSAHPLFLGCRLLDRRKDAALGGGGALGEGAGGEREGDRGAEEHGGGDGRRARQEVRAAGGAEDGAGGAAAEGRAEVGALAVLHQHENDDDDGGDDLQNKRNAEQEVHGLFHLNGGGEK